MLMNISINCDNFFCSILIEDYYISKCSKFYCGLNLNFVFFTKILFQYELLKKLHLKNSSFFNCKINLPSAFLRVENIKSAKLHVLYLVLVFCINVKELLGKQQNDRKLAPEPRMTKINPLYFLQLLKLNKTKCFYFSDLKLWSRFTAVLLFFKKLLQIHNY